MEENSQVRCYFKEHEKEKEAEKSKQKGKDKLKEKEKAKNAMKVDLIQICIGDNSYMF